MTWWVGKDGRSYVVYRGEEAKARFDPRKIPQAEAAALRCAEAMAGDA